MQATHVLVGTHASVWIKCRISPRFLLGAPKTVENKSTQCKCNKLNAAVFPVWWLCICCKQQKGCLFTEGVWSIFHMSHTSSCDLSPWDRWGLDTTSQQVLPSEKLVRVKTNRLCSELQTAASIKSFLPLSSWRIWTTPDIDLLGAQDLDSEGSTAKPWWPQEAGRPITRSECHQKERRVEMEVICCWDIHGSEHFLAAGASNEAN